ncbi:MAG: DinB family protein [Acidimicrobiales bacterium]
MTEFIDADLRGALFENVELRGAEFRRVHFDDAQFRAVDMSRVVMRGVDLIDVDIDGEIENLTINGVDVAPLIEAELDRRHPDRAKMRPTDPDGFREAWHILDRLWEGTLDRARRFTPDQLHECVDNEWSFIETLRHLVFATDCWVRRTILGDPSPWDALGLPFAELPDGPEFSRARNARPSLDEVLAVRRERTATVRDYLEELTQDTLDAQTTPVDAPGWPPPKEYPIRRCLLIVLNEEWQHRLYAERDFDILDDR